MLSSFVCNPNEIPNVVYKNAVLQQTIEKIVCLEFVLIFIPTNPEYYLKLLNISGNNFKNL